MNKIKLIITLIVLTSLSTACLDKGEKVYMHSFSGVWEIESYAKYIRTDDGYSALNTYNNIGFIQLYDNGDDIGKYNNSYIKVDTSIHACFIKQLTGNDYNTYNNAYWYADENMRLTLWYYVSFNYVSWENYTTFTVDKTNKNKQVWSYYYNLNDSTGSISPYMDPTHMERLVVKLQSH